MNVLLCSLCWVHSLKPRNLVHGGNAEQTGLKCSPLEVCCKTRRGQWKGLAAFGCALIFIILLAVPGGIVQFIEPSFGEFTDLSGVSLSPGLATLDVTVSRFSVVALLDGQSIQLIAISSFEIYT